MTFAHTLSYDTRARSFWTLAMIVAACLVVYVYAVNATVRNTVARATLEQNTTSIASQIAEMEFSYIGEKNTISLQMAYARGFQNVTSPLYISRASAHSLSFNSRR